MQMLTRQRMEVQRRQSDASVLEKCTFRPQLCTLDRRILENPLSVKTVTESLSPLRFVSGV